MKTNMIRNAYKLDKDGKRIETVYKAPVYPAAYLERLQLLQGSAFTPDGELRGCQVVQKRDWEMPVNVCVLDVGDWGQPEEEIEELDNSSVDQPYFTKSGDNPVIWDEAEQNEWVRSEGGYSDLKWEQPELEHYSYGALASATEDERKYLAAEWAVKEAKIKVLKDKKLARELEYNKVIMWFDSCKDIKLFYKGIEKFVDHVKRSRKECARTGDWSNVWLTKEQVGEVWNVIKYCLDELRPERKHKKVVVRK